MYSPTEWGEMIRRTRTGLGVTQENLALTAGTGLRFIVDLEKGKPTCQIGKALTVLKTLGIKVKLVLPGIDGPLPAIGVHGREQE